MRLFVALHLEPALRQPLAALLMRLRSADRARQVRWVEPGAIHLTLKFLGEVEAGRSTELASAVARAVAGLPAPVLALGTLGAFPNPRRPRVLWVGLEETGRALIPLQAAIEAGLEPLGFAAERRAFQPHLTLGRVREGPGRQPVRLEVPLHEALAGVATVAPQSGVHRHLAIIQSHLSGAGSRYEDRASWELGSSEAASQP